MPNYNPEHKAVLDEILLGYPLVPPARCSAFPRITPGKSSASACMKTGSVSSSPRRLRPGCSTPIRTRSHSKPMGKARMREWVQINVARSEDYRGYRPLFEESIQYLLSQQENSASGA